MAWLPVFFKLLISPSSVKRRAGVFSIVATTALLAACSRPGVEPLHYDNVVALVQSIAYEPDLLGELLGRRVALELRPFSASAGYYVRESYQISFQCRSQRSDFHGGIEVDARIVDFESSPSGVTTITLDSCAEKSGASQLSAARAAGPGS